MSAQKQSTTAAAAQTTDPANDDFNRLLSGPVSFGPRSMSEAVDFSKKVSASQLVPKDYQGRPENVFAAIQWGAEIGLSPMQALQGIAIINGRPSLWGDVMLALVMSHPAYEWHREGGDDASQWFEIKRRGQEAYRVSFSMEDAKKASLAGKTGPWSNYPRRMMQMRARGFALRDKFPDALKGMISREEAMDYASEPAPVSTQPRTEQTYDTTGQTVDPGDPIIGPEKRDIISGLLKEFADLKGRPAKWAAANFGKAYARTYNDDVLPDDLAELPESRYEWATEQLDIWIQKAQPAIDADNAETAEPEPETETAEQE